MTTKAFPIKLDETTHYQLKRLAAISDVSIGGLIDMMTRSLSARLEKYRNELNLPATSMVLDPLLIKLLVSHDVGEISDDVFSSELAEIAKQDTGWTPDVELP